MQQGPMADWRIVPNVRLKYLALDKESGHVIVQKGDGSPLGMPYLVLLPWGAKKQRRRTVFLNKMKALALEEVGLPYPLMKYRNVNRLCVAEIHPILFLHYWPALRDGTEWGEREHVVYRLKSKQFVGVCPLEQLQAYFASRLDLAPKLRELEAFVTKKRNKIRKCKCDGDRLRDAMGLRNRHDDITVPQMGEYSFKHFNFGYGHEQSSCIEEMVDSLHHASAALLMECAGCVSAPAPDRTHPPVC